MRKRILVLVIVLVALLFSGCTRKSTKPDAAIPATPKPTKEVVVKDDDVIDDDMVDNEQIDAVTTPSIVDNADAIKKALSINGTWIAATLNDIVVESDIIVEGEFENKGQLARKIALYTQDDDYNITNAFTLTAPKLIIRSENTKLHGGTFIGDVYVESDGFDIGNSASIQGNLYFTTQGNMNSATIEDLDKISGDSKVLDD